MDAGKILSFTNTPDAAKATAYPEGVKAVVQAGA